MRDLLRHTNCRKARKNAFYLMEWGIGRPLRYGDQTTRFSIYAATRTYL